MRNIVKKFVVIFLATIITLSNFLNVNSIFSAENLALATGYVNIPSWITKKELNVRSQPSQKNSKILGTIPNGSSVKIINATTEDEDNDNFRQGWYKVSYKNLTGYVFGDYIKIPQQEKIYTPSNSTAIKGIDLSYHQNNIDWQKVKNSGIKFVIIRGGYSTIEDKNFKTHMEGALNAGLDVGVYWYSKAYTLEGAKSEAKKCMEVVSPYKDKLSFPIYFDFEEDAINRAEENNIQMTMTLASNIAETFLSSLKSKGYKCGIYSNILYSKYYFTEKIRTSYDFWIAQYTDDISSGKCTYWNKYNMWQYSKTGKVDGIDGYVDLNYYYKNNPINISKSTINNISNQIYSGKSITPNITVKYNNKTLIKNTDYTIKYKNNKSIGTASIIITGKNNYTGKKTITFKIVPQSVTNFKISNVTHNSVKLTWPKVSNVSGYEIYRSTSKNGTYSKITTTSNLNYINKKLSKKKTYYYKIRTYKTVNNKKIYGSYSSIKSIKTK